MTMQQTALLGRALSEATRIRIVAALRGQELCVCEICDALQLSQSTLSTHLQTLRRAGFVRTRKDGKWIYYGLEEKVSPLVDAFFTLAAPALVKDKRIAADAERVQRRLKMREDECCLLGFDQLDGKGGEKE